MQTIATANIVLLSDFIWWALSPPLFSLFSCQTGGAFEHFCAVKAETRYEASIITVLMLYILFAP